jgi:signal peptidase I
MSKPRSIFYGLSIRTKWTRRRLVRSQTGRTVNASPDRLSRWWSLYQLRFSWSKFFGEFGSVTCLLCLATLSFLFVSHFVFESVQVIGPSMYPTLLDTDIYWIDKWAYAMGPPKPGDIIALKDPSGRGLDVKRIIAVPGQSVYISHGKVYVNGHLLREPYLPQKELTFAYDKEADKFVCLGPDQYFVMGDNRGNSCDSRTFGPIAREAILGRVIR